MINLTLFNISKNGKKLLPSLGTRVSRCYSCEDKKGGKGDKFALSKEVENGINDQINKEIKHAFEHIAMAEYYNRRNVGLPGFAKDHGSQIKKEMGHVKKLVKILSQRGGNLTLKPIEPPASQEWKTPVDVEKAALQSEKTAAQGIMDLQNVAAKAQDHHVASTVSSSLMPDQMKCMFEMEQRLGKLEQCSKPECLLALDSALLKSKKPKRKK